MTILAVPLNTCFYAGDGAKVSCSVQVPHWIICNLVRSHGKTMSPGFWALGIMCNFLATISLFFYFDSELTSYPRFYLTMSSSNDGLSVPTLTGPNYLSWASKMCAYLQAKDFWFAIWAECPSPATMLQSHLLGLLTNRLSQFFLFVLSYLIVSDFKL